MKKLVVIIVSLMCLSVASGQVWLNKNAGGGPNTVGAGKSGGGGGGGGCAAAGLNYSNTCDTVYITGIFQ